MTDDTRPLHVRVAEVLGCNPVLQNIVVMGRLDDKKDWCCLCPNGAHRAPYDAENPELIARYDVDWAETGPLLEEFDILISPQGGGWIAAKWSGGDYGDGWVDSRIEAVAHGPSILTAVCNCILAAKEKGLL